VDLGLDIREPKKPWKIRGLNYKRKKSPLPAAPEKSTPQFKQKI
jgi:hypothetical protein